MKINSLSKAFFSGLTADSGSGFLQKTLFGRHANVPLDAGDGFSYNQPWQIISATGRPLSDDAVLRLSAAMACVRLLSQVIATLPLGVFERLGDGARQEARGHWAYELLHNEPNAYMTAADFWQVMVAWMMLRGNGYAEKLRIGGRIVALNPLAASMVSCRKLPNGEPEYTYTESGKRRVISRADMWHIPAFTLDGIFGLSPIRYGSGVFSGAMAADDASRSIFESGMSAAGVITMPPDMWLDEGERKKLVDSMNDFRAGGARRNQAFVLEGGMQYAQLSINPEDAQMLESRMFNIEEICRWFGIDPSLIGHGQKVSNYGTGLEEKNLGFLAYCLTPWLRKIEQSIRKNLFTPAEKLKNFAEFNVAGLLRGNALARAEYYARMVNNGLMTSDEVRRAENLPPMGGNAEALRVQSAMVPLNMIGSVASGSVQPESSGVSQDTLRTIIRQVAPDLGDSEVEQVLSRVVQPSSQ